MEIQNNGNLNDVACDNSYYTVCQWPNNPLIVANNLLRLLFSQIDLIFRGNSRTDFTINNEVRLIMAFLSSLIFAKKVFLLGFLIFSGEFSEP